MIDSRFLTVFAVTILVTAFCYAEPSSPSLSDELIPGVIAPPAGTYSEPQVLIPATFAPGSVARYRFVGHESWIPFDRPLYLSAFVGEERTYSIEFQSSGTTNKSILTYTIDVRPPEPPVFSPLPGDVEGSLNLHVEGAGNLFISIDGAPFVPYPASSQPSFNAEKDATRIVSATAFAVDSAGNIAQFSSSRWRVHPVGLTPSFPFTPESDIPAINKIEKDAEVSAELVDMIGSARLTIRVPDGTVPCLAVNASDPFMSVASYAELSGTSVASCLIPFPWGDETEIVVHYGYKRNGERFIVSVPVRLKPGFPVDQATSTLSSPVAPLIRIEESTAFIAWPATPWTTLFSIGSEEFSTYQQPIRIELGSTPKSLQYYMLDRSGARSSTGNTELPSRYTATIPLLAGVENGKTYGDTVLAVPRNTTKLRYELAEGNNPASAITSDSPVLALGGLRFEGKSGSVIRYQLRVVAEPTVQPEGMIAAVVQERFFSFTVDREPPQIPEAMKGLRSFSSSDSVLSFKPQSGTILVSISEDGQGPYQRYDGPVAINGSDEGRKRFVIRAYAEDEFGNRSDEMSRMEIMIDRSSLYVDSRGRSGASGSPDDPIPYLDDAIEAAQTAAKRFIYIRGTVALRKTVVITRPLTIIGGFDAVWNDASNPAFIKVAITPSSSTWAFVVDGGSISFVKVSISMNDLGSGGLVFSRSGPVNVSGSTIKLSGGIDIAVLKSTSSSIALDTSSIELSDSITARGIEIGGASLKLTNCTIQCKTTVKLFDAIRISNADASISGLKMEAAPSQALSGISAIHSTTNIESAVISIAGGTSSSRIFSANASCLTVSSVYIDSAWQGSTETFSVLNDSTLKVAHVTALVDAPRAVFANSQGSNLMIVNTIASFPGISSIFIRSDTVPMVGSVSANSLWGFSQYMDGKIRIQTLVDFNKFINPAKLNFSEDPSRMFAGSIKGLYRLSKTSACFDGGSPVDWASSLDLLGKQRISAENRIPDIGAEEL